MIAKSIDRTASAELLQWISANRGALSKIARKIGKEGVTPQFVGMVLRGVRKSKKGRVERELKRSGAPVQM